MRASTFGKIRKFFSQVFKMAANFKMAEKQANFIEKSFSQIQDGV
jgi:hypothetical protein